MIRTQIYITESEQKALRSMALKSGKKQSEIIREAIDQFVDANAHRDKTSFLKQARGMWQDREDLPDFAEIRRSFERTG